MNCRPSTLAVHTDHVNSKSHLNCKSLSLVQTIINGLIYKGSAIDSLKCASLLGDQR